MVDRGSAENVLFRYCTGELSITPGGGGFGGAGLNITTPTSSFYDLNTKYTYSPEEPVR